ncbi:RidA family protein [Microvirga guangxiensis]|uniref:Enamine deaminase RidA, house cleaning of reactive enamine intermediates, YjgF/YER057c/UK114 family n=1 Tax=Microvirga guangxiensis TaxID=549386 RepID=A0A1G5K163_9HYPH|nr:RidA family protein [Microvirga guangxiensis]SCY94373.1 Enamine deaminase RidA, house cleaning of reactive enamine intermediates, YjgF/YER057c/UK114 family [Microvirga guangxiensis]
MTVSKDSQTMPFLDDGVEVLQPKNWPVPKGYSNGMMAEGKILVTGGVVGWNEAGEFPEGFVSQARQVFENICAILAEGGAKPQHIIRLTWYVVDIDDYLANLRDMGRAYRSVFGAHYPAMALVQVVRLVEKAALLEIEATAVVPSEK